MKSVRWRTIVVATLTLLALYGIAPTAIYFAQPTEVRNDQEILKNKIPSWLPSKHINLGLDLQGGVQLVLGVSTDEAVENRLNRIGTEVTRWAEDQNLKIKTAYVKKGEKLLRIEIDPETDIDKFREGFREEFPNVIQKEREDHIIDYGYSDEQVETIRASAIEQALRVVRNRVDKWGVSEAVVSRRGSNAILVQLPGFKDPEKAKGLLGRTAQLKFKMVDEKFDKFQELVDKGLPPEITAATDAGFQQLVSENRDLLLSTARPLVPEDRELLLSREELAGGKKARYKTYVVEAATELTGEDILDAFVASGGSLDRTPVVSLRMTGPGGKRFADITGENVGRYMAIVLDDVVESAPVIQQKISGGQAQITLGGSRGYNEIIQEANELSLILKSGSLPATIEVLEERQVGATLGPQLANQGIKGILFGLAIVLVFMLVYYRRPGFIACLALVLNGIFLLAAMASFGFSLTLPGIAGFILTLGMAVDANVLINERIRQELREGKNAKKAVENGFEKVFWTIIDANVTTLIAALVLLETNSSGPIRGFAITLILGLLVSMFTSLYCSRLFFEIALRRFSSDSQIRTWLGTHEAVKKENFNINFLNLGKAVTSVAIVLGLTVIGGGIFSGLNFGVDFKGGTELLVGFNETVDTEQLRDIAKENGAKNLIVQAVGEDRKQFSLRFDADASDTESGKQGTQLKNLQSAILSKLEAKGPQILQSDFVGPQIGQELRTQGIVSVIWAVLGVLLYIGLRFDMRFGPGAVVKMLIDVCIMFGFYVFARTTFDLTSVAAFLTVVGYSVNDTIVIYDRIRENLMINAKRKLFDNINASLNETFTRTLNTSLTTVGALIGILFFGTGQIWNFAMALTIGVIVATLSSTFIASSFVLWLEDWKKTSRTRRATQQGTAAR